MRTLFFYAIFAASFLGCQSSNQSTAIKSNRPTPKSYNLDFGIGSKCSCNHSSMTQLPTLSNPKPVLTTNPNGQWHFNDNWADGTMINYTTAQGEELLALVARMGSPPPGGVLFFKKNDGDIYNGWVQPNIRYP